MTKFQEKILNNLKDPVSIEDLQKALKCKSIDFLEKNLDKLQDNDRVKNKEGIYCIK